VTDLLLVLAGITALTVGGEGVVRGALAAANRLGVSPLLAGLVIVGFGTSTPELVVSIDAALNARPDIAVGNVVGSNIANVLLVLGICALITPLTITRAALMRDGLTVLGVSVLFVLLAGGTGLARPDAAILIGCLAAYLAWVYRGETRRMDGATEMYRHEAEELTLLPRGTARIVVMIAAGMALLVAGSRLMITGAVGIGSMLGVSEAVIGLTVVAVGTSLPELAVSVLAALRRHADVAVGNILGSNIFNLLGILGVSALLQPLPLHQRILRIDQWVMCGSALVLTLFLATGLRLNRLEGGILLVAYIAYIGLMLPA